MQKGTEEVDSKRQKYFENIDSFSYVAKSVESDQMVAICTHFRPAKTCHNFSNSCTNQILMQIVKELDISFQNPVSEYF